MQYNMTQMKLKMQASDKLIGKLRDQIQSNAQQIQKDSEVLTLQARIKGFQTKIQEQDIKIDELIQANANLEHKVNS